MHDCGCVGGKAYVWGTLQLSKQTTSIDAADSLSDPVDAGELTQASNQSIAKCVFIHLIGSNRWTMENVPRSKEREREKGIYQED